MRKRSEADPITAACSVSRQMTLASDSGRIGVKTATSTVAGLNLPSAIMAERVAGTSQICKPIRRDTNAGTRANII
jgi:hypothetical protein